ncbi:MAG: hypothetical protein LBH21_07940, partial [Gracilibacteraceae bacterium]|nr:hypothetical protein [Gracilibacteraceae bacterium]
MVDMVGLDIENWALHVQCPIRVLDPKGMILFASDDKYSEPGELGESVDFDWQRFNLFDELSRRWLNT